MKPRVEALQGAGNGPSRREFLTLGGKVAAGAVLAGVAIPHVHAAEDNTIRLALIGSGSRGSGAVVNAFESPNGPCKLVAMADIFGQRLEGSYKALSRRHPQNVDVPPERRFVGFDAFKKAIDCLRPGIDIAMLTTYPAFRPVHLDYAVSKGVNVFMEKSFAIDPPGVRRVVKAGQEAKKKNLKIAAGLMCRHSVNRQELMRRIHDGQLGDINLIRAYRMEPCGPMSPKRPPDLSELYWQIRNRTHILWVSGGLWAEMDIHQIDEICWLKDDHYPVTAHGICGRAANRVDAGQGQDSYLLEYTFAVGAKAYAWSATFPSATRNSPPSSTAPSGRPSFPEPSIRAPAISIKTNTARPSKSPRSTIGPVGNTSIPKRRARATTISSGRRPRRITPAGRPSGTCS